MTPVEEEECVRGINIGGNTQLVARGNGQFDIGELPAFIKFTTHVPLRENMAEWTTAMSLFEPVSTCLILSLLTVT